jgi:hypothetical protein
MSRDAAVEREDPPELVDIPDALAPWRATDVDPVVELAKFEAAVDLQRKLLPASIKATRPEDWVDQGGKAYLQATGVERLAPLWGLVFGKYTVEREDHGDGSYSYVVRGPIMSRRTGVIYGEVVGGRSSSDPFFDEFDERKPDGLRDLTPGEQQAWKRAHRVPPDPLEVRKAAVTNWTTRGASMLAGMRGLTVAYLEDCGVKGISRVEYGTGQKGGATAPADLKARRTAFWNDLIRRAGGEVEMAKQALKDVTKYDAYTKKDGAEMRGFAGATSVDSLSDRALDIAEKKIKEHPALGDAKKSAMREPGEEG